MKKYLLPMLMILFLVAISVIIQNRDIIISVSSGAYGNSTQTASVAASVSTPFIYNFKVEGVLYETGEMNSSPSGYWWLNSGGSFHLSEGVGKTAHNEINKYSKWRLLYSSSNPIDTDNGYHPQNIFRLITRGKWENISQEADFKINKLNMSASSNRNASNGLLFFNRYIDSDNLYYIGVRVDGTSVIKKKTKGVYFTIAQIETFESDAGYNRDTNPNMIPGQLWFGMRSEINTMADGMVKLSLYVDRDNSGNWELALQGTDDGVSFGGDVILEEGFAGIRTDFMDAEFDNYRITEI